MDTSTIIVILIALGLFAVILVLLVRMAAIGKTVTELKENKGNDQATLLLNQNIQGLQQRLDQDRKAHV